MIPNGIPNFCLTFDAAVETELTQAPAQIYVLPSGRAKLFVVAVQLFKDSPPQSDPTSRAWIVWRFERYANDLWQGLGGHAALALPLDHLVR